MLVPSGCGAVAESALHSLEPQGKKNVEVRPAHTNKGEIVQRLLYQYPDTEFCMCAGDDKTDEDMVRPLRLPFLARFRPLTLLPPQFHSMARIFSTATPGAPPLIAPPESLTLFPSLASECHLPSARAEAKPVESKLDPASMYMIAIEARESQSVRMTMANAVLERWGGISSRIFGCVFN